MKAVIFDVEGKMAHFRKPDTTSTQLTYPFITPTAAKGLVGAILGLEDFVTNDKLGIQLLNPVRTVAQQMSMLGTGSTSFNRPTTVELLIEPAYRIYYVGEEYGGRLANFLKKEHAVYPTYLGSAYALTKPRLYEITEKVHIVESITTTVEMITVVPTKIIQELQFQPDCHYSRAGGFLHLYTGQRTFEQSIDFIYERTGKSVSFIPKPAAITSEIQLALIGEKTVCLF